MPPVVTMRRHVPTVFGTLFRYRGLAALVVLGNRFLAVLRALDGYLLRVLLAVLRSLHGVGTTVFRGSLVIAHADRHAAAKAWRRAAPIAHVRRRATAHCVRRAFLIAHVGWRTPTFSRRRAATTAHAGRHTAAETCWRALHAALRTTRSTHLPHGGAQLFLGDLLVAILVGLFEELLDTLGSAIGHLAGFDRAVAILVQTFKEHHRPRLIALRRFVSLDERRQGRNAERRDH
jgi:hypothetical protein